MDIALCFDNNFIMQVGVTIKSVCLSNPQENIIFHLFTNKITVNNQNTLQGLLTSSNHLMKFYEIDESVLTGWPEVSRYPKSIYYRFFIAQKVPSSVNYILYLDCDIIVRDNLRQLYETDLTKNIIAAVYDKMPFEIDTINRLCLPIENGYFNSGVLLINVQQWRLNHITSKLCKIILNNAEKLAFPDQDALNILFNGNWKKLHLRYNLQQGFVYEHTKLYWQDFDELHEAQSNPAIIHYSGLKPWMHECYNPYKQLWLNTASKTPWKNYTPKKLNLIKKIIFELKIFLVNHIHVINERQPFSQYCKIQK